MFARAELIAILFLVGSVTFTVDGVLYTMEDGFTAHNVLYTISGVTFVVGCAMWLQLARQERKNALQGGHQLVRGDGDGNGGSGGRREIIPQVGCREGGKDNKLSIF